jgi:hypothetical protein
MCSAGGFFIIGSLVGEKMLRVPRIFSFFDGGKSFQLGLLPGNPENIILGDVAFRYPIPGAGDDIHAFYKTLLHPANAEPAPKTETPPEPIETMREATPEEEAARIMTDAVADEKPAPDASTPPEILEKPYLGSRVLKNEI